MRTILLIAGLAVVGWLLKPKRYNVGYVERNKQAWKDATERPASYTWTSADGTVSVAWPDAWLR